MLAKGTALRGIKKSYKAATNSQLSKFKQYQQKKSIPAPASWWKLSPEYNNEKDSQNRSDGDDYSFINYAGDKRFGIAAIDSKINFLNDGLVFKIPVYLIQGKEDIQALEVSIKEYSNKINAPRKKYILLPKTDHGSTNQL